MRLHTLFAFSLALTVFTACALDDIEQDETHSAALALPDDGGSDDEPACTCAETCGFINSDLLCCVGTIDAPDGCWCRWQEQIIDGQSNSDCEEPPESFCLSAQFGGGTEGLGARDTCIGD